LLPKGSGLPIFPEETVMKQALLNVVTDFRLMAVCVVISQVIAIFKSIL
jgi:hypothetical protein